jgi:hypothetical protein
VPRWTVSARELTQLRARDRSVEVALDRATVTAGATAHLTITLRKRNSRRLSVVGVVSALGNDADVWPMAVVMR